VVLSYVGGQLPSSGRPELLEALKQQNSKAMEEAIKTMAKSQVDLFGYVSYFEQKSDNPTQDMTMLFAAVWSVMTEAHLKQASNPALAQLSETLQGAVKKFVRDMQQHRPNVLSELIQQYSHKELEKLSETDVMNTLIKELSKGGVVNIYYFEVAMFSAFIECFTRVTYVYKFAADPEYITNDLSHNAVTIATLTFAAYFLLREISQILAMRSLNLSKAYFADFWNYLDLSASCWTIYIIVYFFVLGNGVDFDHLASVGALLMWLKFLSMIKAINKQIATFVLMLSTIFKDLVAFMFVLAVVILMFGHAFFLILGSELGVDLEDGGGNFASVWKTLVSERSER